MKYKNLLSTGRIGALEVKNRLVMPAMSETLTDKKGLYTDDEMAYYAERAKGGTGLIITSFGCVEPRGLGAANQLCAYDIEHIVGLKKITAGVHRYNGRIFLQLHHAGRTADSSITGVQPIGPSPIPTELEFGGTLEIPREMTKNDISEVVERFVFAAGIAKKANFDGVEIHCAHSYLLNQFISPMSNHRTDEYGGTTENRVRIVKEIILGIRETLGRGFPISVRLETEEGRPDGLHIEEAAKIARLLESYGVNMINVSAGGYECERLCIASVGSQEEGYLVGNAEKIKKQVNIPVAVVGLIRSFDMADEIIASGKADFIVMGSPHIADPYLINKISTNRENEIRPCLNCLHCTDSAAIGRMECAVNPTIGYEKDFQSFYKNGDRRKVIVVGGGPCGCEAARVLAIRNFDVTLLEKNSFLGGQVKLASVPPHKEKMMKLFEYYEYNLKRLGVDIQYNTEATVSLIEKYEPFAVFLATGSSPIVPPIDGVKQENVFTAEEILDGSVCLKNQDVAIVGSGGVGIETAAYLLEKENKILLIDMLPEIGMTAGGSATYTLMDIRDQLTMMPGMQLDSIAGKQLNMISVEDKSKCSVEVDSVILALGLRKNSELLEELRKKIQYVETIGNSYQVGDISFSVKHAFYNAYYFQGNQEEMV